MVRRLIAILTTLLAIIIFNIPVAANAFIPDPAVDNPSYGSGTPDPVQLGSDTNFPNGAVLHSPSTYLIFWGSEWQTGWTEPSPYNQYTSTTVKTYFTNLTQSLTGSAWSGVSANYCDNAAAGTKQCFNCSQTTLTCVNRFPGDASMVNNNNISQYAGSVIDSSVTFASIGAPTDTQIANEVLKYSGASPDPSIIWALMVPRPGDTSTGCLAWHSQFTSSSGHHIPLIYMNYWPAVCGPTDGQPYDFGNFSDSYGHGFLDTYSEIFVHEINEAITNPYVNDGSNGTGEPGYADGFGPETGDICDFNPAPYDQRRGYVVMPNGLFFAVQPTWSNWSNNGNPGCGFVGPANPRTTAVSSRLNAGQFLVSSAMGELLSMQGDGNLVLYHLTGNVGGTFCVGQPDTTCNNFTGPTFTVQWNSNTGGHTGAYAVMQGDGNLVVYSSTGTALWNSGTQGHSTAYLKIQTATGLTNKALQITDGAFVYWQQGF